MKLNSTYTIISFALRLLTFDVWSRQKCSHFQNTIQHFKIDECALSIPLPQILQTWFLEFEPACAAWTNESKWNAKYWIAVRLCKQKKDWILIGWDVECVLRGCCCWMELLLVGVELLLVVVELIEVDFTKLILRRWLINWVTLGSWSRLKWSRFYEVE